MQTFGGSGYLADFPVEQYVRDAKIDTLYEGTTAIQGQDLFFRKIVRDGGQALTTISAEIEQFAASDAGNGQLKAERELLVKGLESVGVMVSLMVADLQSAAPGAPEGDVRNVYQVGLNTTRLLMAVGDLVCAWLLLRGAEVAFTRLNTSLSAPEQHPTRARSPPLAGSARTVLPKLVAERKIAEATDLSVMDVPEDASNRQSLE